MISLKDAQYPKSAILYAVYFYVRFPVSYRDLEEIIAERGVDLDHVTLNRWVEKYAATITEEGHRRKAPTGRSWQMPSHRMQANDCRSVDHRFIKKLTRPIQAFKSLNSAPATPAGIEVAHMILKGQFDQAEKSGFAQFAALAG
jgi:transposase-like protein